MTDSATTNNKTDDVNQPGTAKVTYEIGDNELPSETVVRATAALMDMPVIELEPLYDAVDPDHLDGLFDHSGERLVCEESSVTFIFNGCRVSVTGEDVVVRLIDEIID